MSKKLPLPLGALEVEALAMDEGLALARDLSLWEVELKSDSQMVVKAVTGVEQGPSSIIKVVEGIRMGLGSFSVWSISHVSRQCNNAAHIMVREASNSLEFHIWVEDTPPVIVNQVLLDVIDEDFGPK